MILVASFCAAIAAFFVAASTRTDITLPNLPVGTLLGSDAPVARWISTPAAATSLSNILLRHPPSYERIR